MAGTRSDTGCLFTIAAAAALTVFVSDLPAGARADSPSVDPDQTGCTPAQRRDALQTRQARVLGAAPAHLTSLADATAPGGSLAGWRLSHGYVVLATAGAVAVDNLEAVDPLPPLLLYEPSAYSTPDEWLDFDGPDDPYTLVGWAYTVPYEPGSSPPQLRCIAPAEWFVHEAGWHLKDGGMQLTPGAATEPPRPPGLAVHMWHPQVWDLHVWKGDQGIPTVAFANPNAREGGLRLPPEAFFYLENGQKRYPTSERR